MILLEDNGSSFIWGAKTQNRHGKLKRFVRQIYVEGWTRRKNFLKSYAHKLSGIGLISNEIYEKFINSVGTCS